jgi:hypothetical protein
MILIDAGPMVALINANDSHHDSCLAIMKKIRPPLWTVWPAVTEAMYLLEDFRAQDALWQMIFREVIKIEPLNPQDLHAIRDLMEKYRNLPMDLADAALMRIAERRGIQTVFTLDKRDFSVYRVRRKQLRVIP